MRLLMLALVLVFGCEVAELYSDGTRPITPGLDAGVMNDSGPGADSGPGVDTGLACVPMCSGRDCGDDRCEGTCGTCGAGDACSEAGTCEPVDPGCTPSCAGRGCGDDGCGGSCGMCAVGQMCTAGSCVSGPPDPPTATCSGTRGRDVGTTVPSATFTDCDGNEVSLDYLCGYDAAWVYSFATWCGICRSEMRTINDWVATQPADRFEMLIVVTSTTEHGTPNAAYCDSIRDEFGLTNATVLFDDGNRFLNTFYYGGAGAEMAYENGVMVQKGGVTRGLIESLL